MIIADSDGFSASTPDEFSAEPATGWVDPLGDLTWTMKATGNPMLSQGRSIRDSTVRKRDRLIYADGRPLVIRLSKIFLKGSL